MSGRADSRRRGMRDSQDRLQGIFDTQWRRTVSKKHSKVLVQEKAPHGDIKDSIQTYHDQVSSTTHIGDLMAQKTPIVYVLTRPGSLKGDSKLQTPVGEQKTPEGDGDNTLDKDNGVH